MDLGLGQNDFLTDDSQGQLAFVLDRYISGKDTTVAGWTPIIPGPKAIRVSQGQLGQKWRVLQVKARSFSWPQSGIGAG